MRRYGGERKYKEVYGFEGKAVKKVELKISNDLFITDNLESGFSHVLRL